MVTASDVVLADNRTVRVHDSGAASDEVGLVLVWHHGSPQTGALLEPLLIASAARGIRLVSYGRPSYGGSTPRPGRDMASAATDVAQIADALGIDRFATMGASGGGPHALACAALLPARVVAAVSLAGLAPFTADFDWYAGMVDDGGPRAAVAGREARARHEETAEFNEESFGPADYAMLQGEWSALSADVGVASGDGPDGLIDDDVAIVSPWGFDVSQIEVPVLLVHGGQDRVVPHTHSEWLLRNCPRAELWSRPPDGHIAVLAACPVAMDWLLHVEATSRGRT